MTPTPAHTAALRAVVAHWNEFGPEHGFEEVIDKAERTLVSLSQGEQRDSSRPAAIADALRRTAQGITLGAEGMGWSPDPALLKEAADLIDAMHAVGVRQEAAIMRLEALVRWEQTDARTSSVAAGRLPSAQADEKEGLVDPVSAPVEPSGATLQLGARTKREPLPEGQLSALIEAAWDRAERATARGGESPETEWTRYGTLVARAVESAHGIDVPRVASQVDGGES